MMSRAQNSASRHSAKLPHREDIPAAAPTAPAAPAADRHGLVIWNWSRTAPLRGRLGRPARVAANLTGAAGAAFFAHASWQFYLRTHSLVGGALLIEQTWFVIAFLVRRPPSAVSWKASSWLLAFGGTFAGVLLRPSGAHPHWGVVAGAGLQLTGLAVCITSLVALGSSFGFVAAHRGLVTSGPYAVVRHPVYASYLLIQLGYLLQSISLRNVLVMALASGCNIGRALAEERLLAGSSGYRAYRRQVRWRLIPGLW
jgi:protein-S-isoprenylcysteine O-methyltransferase Ste14